MRFLFLFLILAAQGWGATYYAAKVTGTWYLAENAWPTAASTACAASDIEGCLVSAGANNTLVIASGTYGTTDIDAADGLDSVAVGQTIRGPVSASNAALAKLGYGSDPAHATYNNGATILDGATIADHFVSITHTGTIVSNLTIQNTVASKRLFYTNTGTGIGFNDVRFIWNAVANDQDTVYTSTTFNRCRFGGYISNNDRPLIRTSGASALATFNNCIFEAAHNALEVSIGTARVNNSIFTNLSGYAVRLTANANAKDVIIANSVFVNYSITLNRDAIQNLSTGGDTLVVKNNLIHASVFDPLNFPGVVGAYTDGGGNIFYKLPKWKASQYQHIVVMSIDDAIDAAYALQMADAVEPYGWRMAWSVDTAAMTASNWTQARALVARGHEIASHTRNHANLKDLSAMQIRYVGAEAACTMTIAAGTLTTSTGGSWALTGSVGQVCSAIDANADYTCASSTMVPDVDYAERGRATSLADVAAQDIKTATYLALYDATRHYAEEIAGSKSDIEANIPGYTCKTLVHPGNHVSDASKAATLAAGYVGVRATGPTGSDYLLYDAGGFDIGNMVSVEFNTLAPHGTVSQYAATLLAKMGLLGWYMELYEHDYATFTLADLNEFLLVLRNSDAMVLTRAQAAEWIIANGTDSGDGRTYDLVNAQTTNYDIAIGSPLINAGVDVGLTTDIEGRPIRGLPDIGAYEFQKTGGVSKAFLLRSGRHR